MGNKLVMRPFLPSDRNAFVEGYIQHFLYTYRYFCTPEEFLQFLMEKFNSSVM